MAALTNYRLAFSTISKATLLASSSYLLENLPIQSDQTNPGLGWTEPVRDLTKRLVPARITKNADLSASADGFFQLDWAFPFWTFGQMQYLLDTAFGGANVYGVMSLPVTLQTFVETNYVAAHALLARPVWGQDFQTEDSGYRSIVLRFSRGVIIS